MVPLEFICLQNSDVPRADRDMVSMAWRAAAPRRMMETITGSCLVAWAPSTNGLSGGLLKEGGQANLRMPWAVWKETVRFTGWGLSTPHHC